MKSHSNTDISFSFLPSPYVHWYTISLEVQTGTIPRLCLMQDYVGNDFCLCCRKERDAFHCSSLHQHWSLCRGLCISLHWEIKCFKALLSTKKKVHYLCNTAYDHKSGKYPSRSWYNVKFFGAWTFHAVLSVRNKRTQPLLFI